MTYKNQVRIYYRDPIHGVEAYGVKKEMGAHDVSVEGVETFYYVYRQDDRTLFSWEVARVLYDSVLSEDATAVVLGLGLGPSCRHPPSFGASNCHSAPSRTHMVCGERGRTGGGAVVVGDTCQPPAYAPTSKSNVQTSYCCGNTGSDFSNLEAKAAGASGGTSGRAAFRGVVKGWHDFNLL